MFIDILLISSLVLFTILGACGRLGIKSRKVYSLLTSFGLVIFVGNILDDVLSNCNWYQAIINWTNSNSVISIFVYFVAITISTLLISLIINLFFKVIELSTKDAGAILPRLCGATVALASCVICIAAVFKMCSYFNVQIDAPLLNSFLTNL